MLFTDDNYLSDVERVLEKTPDWTKVTNKSVFITGASGMIGTFLIDVLMYQNKTRNANISIWAMGRTLSRLEERFTSYLEDPLFHIVIGDVTEEIQIAEACDYVLHCASNTHPKSYASDPIGTIMTNIAGTQHILDYVVKANSEKVLFLSTVEIYGENRGDLDKFTEDYCGYIDCNTLRAGYPEGKRASESLCQAYIQKYGIDVVIPRISRTFGPTMLLSDSKASSQFIMNAVHKENIVLKSAGTQLYSYAYVADIVSALLFLLVKGQKGEAYNVSNEHCDITLRTFAETLANVAGTKVIHGEATAQEKQGFSKATKALLDNQKIYALGWRPLYDSMEEPLKHTIKILEGSGN